LAEDVRAAEKLKETLWGKEIEVILEKISVGNATYKYVPKAWIEFLDIGSLRYLEGSGLLVRPEYEVAVEKFRIDRQRAKAKNSGGVIVTGQPGIGVFLIIG
jgi:hypothetical protein